MEKLIFKEGMPETGNWRVVKIVECRVRDSKMSERTSGTTGYFEINQR